MFSNLIESSSNRWGWIKHPWVIAFSVVIHVFIFAGLVWAANTEEGPAEEEIDPDDITYVDVTEVPPPPEPEAQVEAPEPVQPEPEPQQAAPAPMPPRVTPPEITEPDEAAGFQELQTPEEVLGIPPEQAQAEAVREEDFGGRGQAGGVAGGTPPEQTGAGGEGTDEGVPAGGTYTANMVDRAVELSNRSEVARQMQNLYPTHLRNAGVGGRVVVQFVVSAEGRVESGSIRVISAPHPDLAEQTRRALSSFRFRPARKGDRNVRQLVQMPIQWQPER